MFTLLVSFLIFILPYMILFVLALLMPGKRSLFALAGIGGLALGWLAWESFDQLNAAPGGAVQGAVFSAILFLSAVAGLLSGVATRAWFLWRPTIRQSRGRSIVLTLCGVVAIPLCLAAAMWWSKWDARIPDDDCLRATHHISIAGADLWLPSAPIFTLWTGGETFYAFVSDQPMREFCRLSLGAGKPVAVVNLMITARNLDYRGRERREEYCARGERAWEKQLCETDPSSSGSSEGLPKEISLYSGEFHHKRMPVLRDGAHAKFVKERNAGILAGRPLEVSETPDFSRFSNRYWIARDATWKNDAGEPFTLYCHETQPSGMLACSTTYRLKLGPYVSYSFASHQDELASVAKTVDASLHEFIQNVSRK